MNENEQLAWWVFGPSDATDDQGTMLWRMAGERVWSTPRFRESNEWAGTLEDRLGELFDIGIEKANGVWSCRVFGPNIFKSAFTRRDAVVDAALGVIKRESSGSATAEPKP